MSGTAVASRLEQRVSFRGSICFARPSLATAPTLAVSDTALADELGLLDKASAVVRFERRPVADDIESVAEAIRSSSAVSVVGIGSGALLDLVKLAVHRVESDSEVQLELAFVPCGPEPYRAVAQFAVVDDGAGGRPTVVDERFAKATVFVVADLLERLPATVTAVHSLDTAVHACESLLGALANPASQALASSALEIVTRERADDPDARPRLVVASFIATEAFMATRLGLAHALASPLGTECGITHDTINGILAEPLIELWGAEAVDLEPVARACRVEASPEAIGAVFARLRDDADLPATLAGLGIAWTQVEAVLPKAAASSGIAVLPRPLAEGGLDAFARRAWNASRETEDSHA